MGLHLCSLIMFHYKVWSSFLKLIFGPDAGNFVSQCQICYKQYRSCDEIRQKHAHLKISVSVLLSSSSPAASSTSSLSRRRRSDWWSVWCFQTSINPNRQRFDHSLLAVCCVLVYLYYMAVCGCVIFSKTSAAKNNSWVNHQIIILIHVKPD